MPDRHRKERAVNRRSFLKAAASVMPMAAIGAPAAEAIVSVAAPAGGLGGMLAGGSYAAGVNSMAAPTAAGIFSKAAGIFSKRAYEDLNRIGDGEHARYRWWAAYRRHRIEVRQGKAQPVSAQLIWAREKLLQERREENKRFTEPPGNPNRFPRLIKSKVKSKQTKKRRINALKRNGYKTWPWGSPL